MRFLDRFRKKHRRVEDPTFGTLTYEPPWWRGKVLFRPCSSEVAVTIESDEHGPSEQQRERFRELDQKYQHLLNFVLDPATKRLVVRRKDEEVIADKSLRLREKVGAFFNEEIRILFDHFLALTAERRETADSSRFDLSGVRSAKREAEEVKLEHLRTPVRFPAPFLNSHPLSPAPAATRHLDFPDPPRPLRERIRDAVADLDETSYVIVEFSDSETSALDSFRPLFNNILYFRALKSRDPDLFEEYNIDGVPTYIGFLVHSGRPKRIRMIMPTAEVLQNTLCDLSNGDFNL